MAQKYTPLNLSFLQNQYSPNRDSIANTAQMIMSNAGWSQPSQASLREVAKAQAEAKKQYNSAHKQSFLSSVFDLLQTPLYGVANALDESLAGHQESSHDSVISDVGKSIGGLVTGSVRGVGAGLRGATGILDALPGVDISDEWQSNPSDKTHIGDVVLRDITGMSTANAVDPKNAAKVKAKVEELQKKGYMDRTSIENVLAPFLPDPNDPKLQKKLYRDVMLGTIPVDMGIDPLNAVTVPARAGEAITEATKGLEAAKATKPTQDSILQGLNTKAADNFPIKAAELGAPSPVASIAENVAPGATANITNVAPEAEKTFKTLGNIGRREGGAEPGVMMTPRDQQSLAGQIAKWSTMMSGSTWRQRAFQLLHSADENVDWLNTLDFLKKADAKVTAIGASHNPARMMPALLGHIRADLQAARPAAHEIERRLVNEKGPGDIVIKPNPARLKVPEARLANQTVRKFEGEILGRAKAPGTGEALANAIAEGRNVRYSGPQQARMWNQITSSLKFANPKKFDKTVRILRSVEDYFISKGVIPHSAAKTAESVPIRLSQVAEAIGPQFLGKSHAFITGILRGDPKALAQLGPDQIEALRNLRASEATAVAPAVQKGIGAGQNIADMIAKMPASVARKNELTNTAIRDVKQFTAASGGGDVGAHVAGEYMGNILGKNDTINMVLRANKFKTEEWLAKAGKNVGGKVNDPAFLKSVTTAITKAADLPSPKQLSGAIGSAARVADWLGARFNAAYGVHDMSPMFLKLQASAMSTTARRAKLINELGRRFPPSDADLWHEAFRSAQQNGVSGGAIAQLQSEIGKVMENLFGGTGLRSGAVSDSTVVGRNRILLDELNKNLKRFGLSQFKFESGAKVQAADGTIHDFSQGSDWLKSWEIWNVKRPYEFLHKVQNVMEYTVREKNMFDEIASRFGSATKSGDVRYGVNHPRLAGYFFTKEGAQQAQQVVKMLEQISTPNAKGLQYFDHVLSKLKAGLTIYGGLLGHQMTNLIGSTYFNWIAGVNKPIRYEQAIKTMLAQKGRYGDFASFDKLAGPKSLEQAVARSMVKPDAGLEIPAAGNKVIVTMQNGTKVTADMLYTAAFNEGILPSAKVLEDVESGVTSVLDKVKPLGGYGQKGIHAVSEVREHIPRMALFIDRVAKSKGTFAAAVKDGSAAVRKWHPDGMGFTQFERSVMKRVFPFYSWTRKAIPLAIESSIFNGNKVMAYPRLMEAIGLANGVDANQNLTDPFPSDQMFPDWLRNRGIGPIAGGPGNYLVANPSTPVLDVLAQIGNPGQTGIDMLNPMAKVPIEVMQGQTLGDSGAPLQTNQQWLDYFTKQIPVASTAGRISGQVGVSDSTRKEGFPNNTNLINMLTGLKMVNTGKYQKSAQFDLRDYFKKKAQQQGPK